MDEEFVAQPFGLSISINRDLVESDEVFEHVLRGKHGAFKGRPYRRGKDRCLFCGSPQKEVRGPTPIERLAAAAKRTIELQTEVLLNNSFTRNLN